MTIRITTARQNGACDSVVDAVDTGGAGSVQIRTGTQPASANDADAGTLLATFTLAATAFGAAASGTATLAGTPRATTGAAAGTGGHARVKNGSGTTIFDGSVTGTGGGGDFEMSTTTVSVGLDLELTAGTLTMPAG
ncbi:MAG: hypothetical protein ACRD0W_18060 [Acidimicrobiales bacterium]